MALEPGGLIAWLLVGLTGWLAGQFMRGGGYGVVGDIVIGVVGASLSVVSCSVFCCRARVSG